MPQKSSYLTFGFLVGLVVASLTFAFFKPSGSGASEAVKRMKLGHNLPTAHPIHAGLEFFAERVAALSGGSSLLICIQMVNWAMSRKVWSKSKRALWMRLKSGVRPWGVSSL